MTYVVVTRPRSDVTTMWLAARNCHITAVVTRPRSDVTTIVRLALILTCIVVTRPRSDVTTI